MSARERLFDSLPCVTNSVESATERAALHSRLAELTFGSTEVDVLRFLSLAREAGSAAHRVPTPEAAAEWLASHVGRGRRCMLAGDALLRRMALGDALRAQDCLVMSVRDSGPGTEKPDARRDYADTDIGITVAHAGLADSGAIVISSSENESRSVSLLPVEHVALLPAARILPSLLQAAPLLRRLTTADGTSAATIVGGPSKTADIEKVLVTGVHGPAALTILVIDSID
jgi:L-lactate utilization protein LutC